MKTSPRIRNIFYSTLWERISKDVTTSNIVPVHLSVHYAMFTWKRGESCLTTKIMYKQIIMLQKYFVYILSSFRLVSMHTILFFDLFIYGKEYFVILLFYSRPNNVFMCNRKQPWFDVKKKRDSIEINSSLH